MYIIVLNKFLVKRFQSQSLWKTCINDASFGDISDLNVSEISFIKLKLSAQRDFWKLAKVQGAVFCCCEDKWDIGET